MPYRSLLIALILALVLAVPAAARQHHATAKKDSEPKLIGVFGGWRAYASTEHGQSVCYMALRAKGAAIKKTKRGPVVIMITQRPGESSYDVFSYTAGYNFKSGSDMQVTVGKTDFDLFTQKDTAWSRDAMTDHQLTAAIRKNASLTATGTPATHGGNVQDTISLKGAPEAYYAIGKACGMPVENPEKPVKSRKKRAR